MKYYFYVMLILGAFPQIVRAPTIGVGTNTKDVLLTDQELKSALKTLFVSKHADYEKSIRNFLVQNITEGAQKGTISEEFKRDIVDKIKEMQVAAMANQSVEFLKKITFANFDLISYLGEHTNLSKPAMIVLNAGEELNEIVSPNKNCTSPGLKSALGYFASKCIEMARIPINAVDAGLKKSLGFVIDKFSSASIEELDEAKLEQIFNNTEVNFKLLLDNYLDELLSILSSNYHKLKSEEQHIISQEIISLQKNLHKNTILDNENIACNALFQEAMTHLLYPKTIVLPAEKLQLNVKDARTEYKPHSGSADTTHISEENLTQRKEHVKQLAEQGFKNLDGGIAILKAMKDSGVNAEEYSEALEALAGKIVLLRRMIRQHFPKHPKVIGWLS